MSGVTDLKRGRRQRLRRLGWKGRGSGQAETVYSLLWRAGVDRMRGERSKGWRTDAMKLVRSRRGSEAAQAHQQNIYVTIAQSIYHYFYMWDGKKALYF
mgnify:CR=1 FL=1|jgi:hypothetical protein